MFEIQIGVFFEVSHNHPDPNPGIPNVPNHQGPNQFTKIQTKPPRSKPNNFSVNSWSKKVVASKKKVSNRFPLLVENFWILDFF